MLAAGFALGVVFCIAAGGAAVLALSWGAEKDYEQDA